MSSESGHGGDSLVSIIKAGLADSKRSGLSLAELVATYAIESGREWGRLLVQKFDGDQAAYATRKTGILNPGLREFGLAGIQPYDIVESGFNLITTGGWDNMLNCAFGLATSGTYGSATCRIGVGTATAAATSGQTDIQGTTISGRYWQPVTGNGITTAGTGVRRVSVTSTMASGDANFAWAEWGIDRGGVTGSGAVVTAFLNRAVSAQGTKASPQVWTATANLDFT